MLDRGRRTSTRSTLLAVAAAAGSDGYETSPLEVFVTWVYAHNGKGCTWLTVSQRTSRSREECLPQQLVMFRR